jgi:hypothetical protein
MTYYAMRWIDGSNASWEAQDFLPLTTSFISFISSDHPIPIKIR